MITSIVFLILAIVLFYFGAIWAKIEFGITPSISNIWYCLEQKGKEIGKPHLEDYFILWFALIALLMQPALFIITAGKWTEPLPIIMGIGLLSVVAAPRYREKENRTYHIAGVFLCALSALIITVGEHWGYGVGIIAFTAISTLRGLKDKNYIYWCERGIFFSFFICTTIILVKNLI